MTNRTLFSLLGGVTLMPMMGAAQTQRPNIIIMNIDDMGYSDPSCFGGDYVNTTNIDRLASEGLSLTQFYTACPISSPSRVCPLHGTCPEEQRLCDGTLRQMAHGRRARCEECTVYPELWLRRVCLYLGEPRPAHHLRQLDMAAH